MKNLSIFKTMLTATVFAAGPVLAEDFNIPAGDLGKALNAYAVQSGVMLIVSSDQIRNAHTLGLKGVLPAEEALSRLLKGTGFVTRHAPSGAIGIVPGPSSSDAADNILPMQLAQAMPSRAAVETVTVTSSKLGGGDVQSIPIAITALSQEQLTATQTAGGPDLVKQVPNLTFTKTNFTGYSIQIRGIGTQAISVTTDPAVAVAFNDIPFIRNHFFEQEFYDVSNVEVLRGPQGTLYGRNATAGVVNLTSAKPTDHYEALASVDVGNYGNRRLEGMLNIPIIGDKLDVRVAGEWTKRDGYSFNATTDKSVDGRDLWSSRITVGFRPTDKLHADLIWEHFSEDDDRMRTAKQLCKKDTGPQSLDGFDLDSLPPPAPPIFLNGPIFWRSLMSQGCVASSLYTSDAFQTPNGLALPFVFFLSNVANAFGGRGAYNGYMLPQVDPYLSQTQSRNLRVIKSDLSPVYHAKNDTIELNADFDVSPTVTLYSQTGYNKDQLYSTEDFNRFNTRPDIFAQDLNSGNGYQPVIQDGEYCDPQLGCSTKLVGEDLSQERAWQFSQEVRLASHLGGPFNFSAGANYLHYQTTEDYFVFINLVSMIAQKNNKAPANDFENCFPHSNGQPPVVPLTDEPYLDPDSGLGIQGINGCSQGGPGTYIDPNPLAEINGNGHNYFRSQNPYRLNSFAGFGEVYYQVTPDIKLTGGLRWTDDSKRFWNIPSWLLLEGGSYVVQDVIDQTWKEWTGRFNVNWTPKLDFTDQTMVYASYARGYKGGGANPPPPIAQDNGATGDATIAVHPASFDPEFVNAFELGTKNTLLDGALTMNGDVFYYDYKGYQISQIVDRTSVNINVNAKIKGAELETTWEPAPGLRFNLSAGYEDTSIDNGQKSIDLINRTGGNPDWVIVKPFVSETSNCILPTSTMRKAAQAFPPAQLANLGFLLGIMCDAFYNDTFGATGAAFRNLIDPTFDPSTAPNNGAGFSKDLSGNKLPNSPPFTLSAGAQYSMPISDTWAGTLRGDFYWQGNSFARIYNDKPYDQLHGYTSLNLTLIFTNQDGWQAMVYAKNVLDTTAITGAFLNTDDTGLTTNVFLTDPRLFGIRITKNW